MPKTQTQKFLNRFQKWAKKSHTHKWTVIKTAWPYPKGYGPYCKGCRTLLDSGLTEKAASDVAKELNGK